MDVIVVAEYVPEAAEARPAHAASSPHSDACDAIVIIAQL
jgi:hypothetical protein